MSIKEMLSKIKIERPLANAHWSLLACLIAIYVLEITEPCSTTPATTVYEMLTITALIILWTRHLVFTPINNWGTFSKYIWRVALDSFLFILLVIVIAIPIMIFSPVYQCYTVRARVSEGLLAASGQRTTIAETYANTGSMPDNYEVNEQSRYVSSLEWIKYEPNSGVLVITLSSDKNLKEAANNILLLKAKGDPSTQSVKFICSKGSVPVKYLPGPCREK